MPTHDTDGCFICMENTAQPIHSGCACRGSAGIAHVSCRVLEIQHIVGVRGYESWSQCHVCGDTFTGKMRVALADKWIKNIHNIHGKEMMLALRNKAQALLQSHMYDDAFEVFQSVLELCRAELQHEDTFYLVIKTDLADLFEIQNKHTAAEVLLREVYTVYERNFGDRHPLTLGVRSRIANTLSSQGFNERAEDMARKSILVQEFLFVESDKTLLINKMNLGLILFRQEKYSECEHVQEKVWAIQKKALGESHALTVCTATYLAASLVHQGEEKFTRAEAIISYVIDTDTEGLKDMSVFIVRMLAVIGMSLRKQNKYEHSALVLCKTWNIQKELLGEYDSETLRAASFYAEALFIQSKYEEASALFRYVFNAHKPHLGGVVLDTVHVWTRLAGNLYKQQHFDHAHNMFLVSLGMFTMLLGKEHELALRVTGLIGNCLYMKNKYKSALVVYKRLFGLQVKLLGVRSEETVNTWKQIAKTRSMM